MSIFTYTTLGRILEEKRADSQPRLTQTGIATELARAGIRPNTQSQVSKLEAGLVDLRQSWPDPETRVKLLRFYGFNDSELLRLDEKFDLGIAPFLHPRGTMNVHAAGEEHLVDHVGTVSAYERNPRRLTQHSPQYASAFLQEYKISREEADRITAEMFLHTFGGVLSFVLDNSDELEEPSLPQAGMRYIPVYSHVGAGPGGEDGVVLRHVEIDADMPGDVAYEVNGHSMEPDIPHGSVVIVKRDSYELGDIVVAWVPDEGMVVKRLIVSKPEDRAVLASSNPDYARLIAEGATIFGRVTEARKRY